ncbi:PIN domain-containing protein, partial [Ruminococcus callidus]|uniref:PIN domain-containing protein n=2 Tax=Ruminococcus callidus TaxID=40519 RepID=UPI0039910C6B
KQMACKVARRSLCGIALDYILKREPFYADAQKVMQLCSTETVDGYIALHTITTIWYLLRKLPDAVRRNALTAICNLLQVTGTTHEEVLHAIQMTTFKDFEDCIQSKCAKSTNADYIITRNVSDFLESEIPVLTPQAFCSMF